MSYYAALLISHRANERVALRYAQMLIAGSPAPYMATMSGALHSVDEQTHE